MPERLEQFLEQLAAADIATRLEMYASSRLSWTAGEVEQVWLSGHAGSWWFCLRSEAGPPGSALPASDEGQRRLLAGEANLADVAGWAMRPGSAIVEPEELMALVQAAWTTALRAGAPQWVRRCGRGLAVLSPLVRAPETARRLLNEAAEKAEFRAAVKQWHALAEAISPLLEDPWLRVAAVNFWNNSGTEVPARIDINPWLEAAIEASAADTLATLRAAEATQPLAGSLADVVSMLIQQRLAGDPVVERLRQIANYGGHTVELAGLVPPEGLDAWAYAAVHRGEPEAARLAAWLLHRHEALAAEQLCTFIRLAPHAEDLPMLAELAADEEVSGVLLELARTVQPLADELADEFVRLFLFGPKYTRGLMRCHAHAGALRLAAAGMRSPFAELAAAILAHCDAVDRAMEGGRQPWLEVAAWARGVVEQYGDQAVDGEVFNRILDAAAAPGLDEHGLMYADRCIDDLAPRERLFAAGLVIRRLGPTSVGWRARFEQSLVRAAIFSEELSLFPYVIAVVDRLLARDDGECAVAELLRDKAKLLGACGRTGRRRAASLLVQAAEEARRAGLIRCKIHAILDGVRLALVGAQLGDEWSDGHMEACAQALAGLDADARRSGMLPEVYEARGLLARHQEDWAASAQWYREALAVSDEQADPAAVADLRSMLAQTLVGSGDGRVFAEAEKHARAALRSLRDDGGVVSRSLAQAVLGTVLLERDEQRSDEAIVLLEDALRAPHAAHGLSAVGQLRLRLAEAYRRAGRIEEAATQVLRVFEARADAGLSLLVEAVFVGLRLETAGGVEEAAGRVVVLLAEYPVGPDNALLRLVHALVVPTRHELNSTIALATAYVRRELPRVVEVDRAIVHLIEVEAPRLPREFLELCLDAAFVPDGAWTAHAKMFVALDRKDRLRALIDAARAGETTPELRRIALVYELQLLADDDPRVPGLLRALDGMLDDPPAPPHLRAEAARLMTAMANGDASTLARAWRHVEAAAPLLDGAELRAAVERLQMAIRGAQLTSLGPVSGPEQVELARWFELPSRLAVHEVELARTACARQLLYTGPLTCEAAIEVACGLLGQVRAGVEPLLRRLAWIVQEQARPGTSGPVEAAGEQLGTKFDEAPAWTVDLVVRGRTDRAAPPGEEAFAWVREAIRARPDRGEVLLGWLAERPVVELTEMAEQLAGLCIDGDRGLVASTLLGSLERVLGEVPNFALQCLQVQLLAASGAWGDGTPYAAAAARLSEAAGTDEQRATALFLRGVERLEAGQAWRAKVAGGADPVITARGLLADAAELARSSTLPVALRFAIFTSAGNSHRDGATPDTARALEFYAEARGLGAPDAHAHAKLCKVTADTLLLRGEVDDHAEVEGLLDASLAVRRSGWLRAETLLTATRAALAREDRPWVSRLRTGLQRLAEAQEHDDGRNRVAIAEFRRHLARRLLAERADDSEAKAVLREVEGIVEDREDERDALHAYSRSELETAARLLEEPAVADFHRFALPLAPLRGYGDASAEGGVTAAVQASLAELTTQAEATLSAGTWLAYAQLSAHLAEQGLAAPEAAMNAAERAERGLEAIGDATARAFLCAELSRLWAPENSWSHPVRDFERAASLAERALEWVPVGDSLYFDLVAHRARATRYRTDGDVRGHLLRAERLYADLVGKLSGARADAIAVNLAEVRMALQQGAETELLRGAIAAAERAVGGEQVTTLHRIALARDRTLLGTRVPEPESSALLARAAADWAALPWQDMNSAEFESADNYRAVCTAARCRRSDDLAGAIAVWRGRLARLDRGAARLAWAMAAHNCADTLVCSKDAEHAAEAFGLARDALEIRTIDAGPVHHLETCQTLADAALVLLGSEAEDLVGSTRGGLIERTVRTLDSGLAAAVRLGGGERRFRLAVRMVQVAGSIDAVSRRMETLERAWAHLDEARPFMLGDHGAAAMEAGLAGEIALQLAADLAEQGTVGRSPGVRFVFEGDRARQVLKWILRGVGSGQRRLAARTRRPQGVEFEAWTAWANAVRSGDAVEVGRCLGRIREHAPGFLSARPDVGGVEHWLHTHDDSSAVIVMLTRGGLLTAMLERGPEGAMPVKLALITTPLPPSSEAAVAASMAHGDRRSPQYTATLAWAYRSVVGVIEGMLSGRPGQLLWCPAGVLGVLSPADLWRDVAVTCVVDPCIRVSPAAQVWEQSALFVADPGGDLEIRGALEIAGELAEGAAGLGNLRVRISCGSRFGAALAPKIWGVVDAPASATGFLEESLAAQLVILVAHGTFEPPMSATLLFVAASGAHELLDLQKLAEDPRRIADKTFVLLSCETARSAGLAGALLACGARRVVAPLWPVGVGAAISVGKAVIAGLASRRDAALVLRDLASKAGEGDDLMAVSTRGFVVWSA